MMDLMRLSVLLLIVGGLNWGSVGVLGKDLVAGLLGARSLGARAVYVAVGLAAVYVAATYFGVLEGFSNSKTETTIQPPQKTYEQMTEPERMRFCMEKPSDSNCSNKSKLE